MSVFVKCELPAPRKDPIQVIKRSDCCSSMEPQCPSVCTTVCPTEPMCCYPCGPPSCSSKQKPNCPPPMPVTCMPCPPQSPLLPCPPRSFVCPPCTGQPCITCAPLPKPVPAPFEFGPIIRAPITTGGLRIICDLCPLNHFDRSSCTITTCNLPLLNTEQQRTNEPYCRRIESIKAVRFKQHANSPQGYGPGTNLIYRPLVQGGLRYRGVHKLVPLSPPPNSPVLCRPASIKPTDFLGMVMYCRPR
ncbi:PREDICTED: keratin-associated protein 16-1-like [Habropoda laboriosa]|uniref:keratin-associated protein 16-1-like n=1 Tax=Habropoda laboriosa TaxID=597456 RepID=UPI00083DACEE|nr:PREDICTED: keratin-associated protein 16-1-like [Habropoda laboriosa]